MHQHQGHYGFKSCAKYDTTTPRESDSRISQLMLWKVTSMHGRVMTGAFALADFFSDLDVGACIL